MNSGSNKSPNTPETNLPTRPENMPDFIVFGAAKSGTTAFHRALSRHRQIFCTTPKEPNFFKYSGKLSRATDLNRKLGIQTESAYRSLFRNAGNSQVRGEASVTYFQVDETPSRIHQSIPKVKLIAILRQPVDQAYSAWLRARQEFSEPIEDFYAACEADSERLFKTDWNYLETGYYARRLRMWFAFFPRDQFKIFLYEDWQQDPEGVLRETCHFLEIPPDPSPTITRDNVTSIRTRFAWLHPLLNPSLSLRTLVHRIFPPGVRSRATRFLRRINHGQSAPLDSSVRAKLTARYEDDITELETLINRDLTHWRAPRQPPSKS